MRRLKLFLGFATLAVIAGTAAALGGGEQGGSIRAVSATFTATTVAHLETRTCTGVDGSYEIAKATYTGTATSAEPSLSGPIELKVRSVFNLTKKLGRVDGRLKIRGTHDASSGKLFAINTNGTLDREGASGGALPR